MTQYFTSETDRNLRKNQIKFMNVPGTALPRYFRNFSGEKRRFNEEGRRVFSMEIEPEIANELESLGWTIKRSKPREDGREYLPRLEIKLGNYATSSRGFGSKVCERLPGEEDFYFVKEKDIGKFDRAVEIESFDITINAHLNQFGRYSCYLDIIRINIAPDVFGGDYEIKDAREDTDPVKSPLNSDDLPF